MSQEVLERIAAALERIAAAAEAMMPLPEPETEPGCEHDDEYRVTFRAMGAEEYFICSPGKGGCGFDSRG